MLFDSSFEMLFSCFFAFVFDHHRFLFVGWVREEGGKNVSNVVNHWGFRGFRTLT